MLRARGVHPSPGLADLFIGDGYTVFVERGVPLRVGETLCEVALYVPSVRFRGGREGARARHPAAGAR